MGIAAMTADVTIPAHVPPELVLPFSPWSDMGDRPHEALEKARAHGGIVYSPQHHIIGFAPNGAWMVTRAQEARQILMDTISFSSANTTGIAQALGEAFQLAPIEVDPPLHGQSRRFLNPLFLPRAMREMEGKIRERTHALVDALAPAGQCDFMHDFAKILPSEMFLDLMGLPHARLQEFMHWEEQIMDSSTFEGRVAGLRAVADYLRGEIRDRRAHPRDDAMTKVATAVYGDAPASESEALGMAMLLYIAGLDTVVNSLGWHFRHLAENPEDQQYLRENPDAIPGAIEEMFRGYSIVSLTRIVARDTELGGVRFKAGDIVSIPTPLLSRDEREFPGGGTINFKAGNQRHMAFGFGPHTCIGMHLAKLVIVSAIHAWLQKIPPFRIEPGATIECAGGAVMTIKGLPLTWRRP
ncbi:Cytochrome P450 [Sphingobium faniae]|nr:Cytochrome P450 [Sphingobium faniae]